MTDISADFDSLLSPHKTHISHHRHLSSDVLDQFLKEAYRINAHITSLHKYLLSIRQSYLSTSAAPPAQRTNNQSRHKRIHSRDADRTRTYLTNVQRDAIDTESKTTLRDLITSIRQVDDVEKIRRDTERQIALKKYGHAGLGGALGRWAAGGMNVDISKSEEQIRDEERRAAFDAHRESVIWYLRQRLGQAAETQREMMERRVEREVEKSKSVLWKVKGSTGGPMNEEAYTEDVKRGSAAPPSIVKGNAGFDLTTEGTRIQGLTEGEVAEIESKLSPEQLQLFAQENNDMLKRYEDTLDQIRTAERSMIEISELQSTLATNLELQATRIDSMVEDSSNTTTNISGGNKQLKRATERFRPAKMVFFASCGLCAFLVGWDLIF